MQAIHPIRYANGTALCRYCSRPTKHYTVFICDARIWHRVCSASERERDDAAFLKACGIAPLYELPPSRVTVEIVMQGAVVRKARELHAMRNRKLMGEHRATSCGELDLGDLS